MRGTVSRMSERTADVEARIAVHVREVLALLGVEPEVDPEVAGTPERVAQLLLELTAGLGQPPSLDPLPHTGANQGLLIAADLPFHSLCAHHLLPFFGRAHIGYMPNATIVGIGALGRTLDHVCLKPQLQERVGEEVASHIERETGALGVIVVLEARQLCMEMRGGRKSGLIETTAARGALVSGEVRGEFFERIARLRGQAAREG